MIASLSLKISLVGANALEYNARESPATFMQIAYLARAQSMMARTDCVWRVNMRLYHGIDDPITPYQVGVAYWV